MFMLFFYIFLIVCTKRQLDEDQDKKLKITKQLINEFLSQDSSNTNTSNSDDQDNETNLKKRKVVTHKESLLQNTTNTNSVNESDRFFDSRINRKSYLKNHKEIPSIFPNHLLESQNLSLVTPILSSSDNLYKNESSNKFLYDSNNIYNKLETVTRMELAGSMLTDHIIIKEKNNLGSSNTSKNTNASMNENSDLVNFIDPDTGEIVVICKLMPSFEKTKHYLRFDSTRASLFKSDDVIKMNFKSRKTYKVDKNNVTGYIKGINNNNYQYFNIDFIGNFKNIKNTCLNIILAIFISNISKLEGKKLSIKPEFLYLTEKKPEFMPFILYIIKCIDCKVETDQNICINDFESILTNMQYFRFESILLTKEKKKLDKNNIEISEAENVLLFRCEIIIYQILYYLLGHEELAKSYKALANKKFKDVNVRQIRGYQRENSFLFTIFLINDEENLKIDYHKSSTYDQIFNIKCNFVLFIENFYQFINNIGLDNKSKEEISKIIPNPVVLSISNSRYNLYNSEMNIVLETFTGIKKINQIYEKFIEVFQKTFYG